jgi:hypothetical protein
MITTRTVQDFRALKDMRELFNDSPRLVQETGERVHQRLSPQLLDELAYTPPRTAVHPFVWSPNPQANRRAQRYFFRKYPNGYKRTGRLAKKWKVRLVVDVRGFRLKVENPDKAAPFVYGRLSTDNAPNLPIIGHKRTGWQPARPTVNFWIGEYHDAFDREFDDLLSYLGYRT